MKFKTCENWLNTVWWEQNLPIYPTGTETSSRILKKRLDHACLFNHWTNRYWFSNTRANYSIHMMTERCFLSGVEYSIIDSFRPPQWIGIVKLEKIDSSSWVGVTAAEDLVMAITSIDLNDFIRWWSIVLLVVASLLYITLVAVTFNGKQYSAV